MADVRCGCGKRVARYEDGVIYLWCKSCKKEVAYPIHSIPGFPATLLDAAKKTGETKLHTENRLSL